MPGGWSDVSPSRKTRVRAVTDPEAMQLVVGFRSRIPEDQTSRDAIPAGRSGVAGEVLRLTGPTRRNLHSGLVLDEAVETLVDLGETGASDHQSRMGLGATHDYRKFVPTLINTHGFED